MKTVIAYCVFNWVCLAMIYLGAPPARYAGLVLVIASHVLIILVAMWRSRDDTPASNYRHPDEAKRARAARRASTVSDKDPPL